MCIEHVIKDAGKICKLDGLIDDVVEPVIIPFGHADRSDSDIESDSDFVEELYNYVC